MPVETELEDSASVSRAKNTRSFIRAFVATNYLLGKRQRALTAGMVVSDPVARQALSEIAEQLSHGVQEQRARALAVEVGRLMRSLSAQRLK